MKSSRAAPQENSGRKRGRAVRRRFFQISIFGYLLFFFVPCPLAKETPAVPAQLNGDVVEYSIDGNMVSAEGNVIITYQDLTLTCDRVEFYRDTGTAHALGHVRLQMPQGALTGEELTFNFETRTGVMDKAKIFSDPYYGKGRELVKVEGSHVIMHNGEMTTCDHDKPHYHLFSKTMDVYPKDKLIGRNNLLKVGNVPVFYIPKFTQDISGKQPVVILTPGHSKDWGTFFLTQVFYTMHENFKGTIHIDVREKKDVAWGVDVDYKVPGMGAGRIRTYYMNERDIKSKHWFQTRPEPTLEKERFKAEWRHKWDIDNKTTAIAQYYKLSDNLLLEDYFERESDEDSSPTTYFLLTRGLPLGILSFRADARVNRFEAGVERLPELRYDLGSTELGESNFFLTNQTSYTNLANKPASPTDQHKKTMRVHTDSEIKYPLKVAFFEFVPFVGGNGTMYSRIKDPDDHNVVRGDFRTGSSVSTKFYKVMEVKKNLWGIEIDRLRHVVTPSVNYLYDHGPTITNAELDQFDAIDSKNISHSINFSIENKLQTKRSNSPFDLVRALVETNLLLKENPSKPGFDNLKTEIEIKPTDRFSFYFDTNFNFRQEVVTGYNFEMYINKGDEKWWWNVSQRWLRQDDDILTSEWYYKINPKWQMKLYDRFNFFTGTLEEQQYTVIRDLHAWEMEMSFNETRAEGDEFWLIFRLKAFPEMSLDLGGATFNKRKVGSQSWETPAVSPGGEGGGE